MKSKEAYIFSRRQALLLVTLGLYLLPLALLVFFVAQAVSLAFLWKLVIASVLLLTLGSTLLYATLIYGELRAPHLGVPTPSTVHDEAPIPEKEDKEEDQQKVAALNHELFIKEEDLRRLYQEKELWEKRSEELASELAQKNRAYQDELDKLGRLLHDSKQTIVEQRAAMEVNLEKMNLLASKNDDLRYEIKTLLQVAQDFSADEPDLGKSSYADEAYSEASSSRITHGQNTAILQDVPVRTMEEARQQLTHCIGIAQKISGAHTSSVAGGVKYRTGSTGGFTLDMRQLFDALRQESASVVIFYSWNESKPLFVNSEIKELLGWSPELFLQDFPTIIADGVQEWKHSLSELRTKAEAFTRIVMKTKAGTDATIHCLLGRIPSGLFKNHVLAILFGA